MPKCWVGGIAEAGGGLQGRAEKASIVVEQGFGGMQLGVLLVVPSGNDAAAG